MKPFLSFLLWTVHLFLLSSTQQEPPLPIPVVEENNNFTSFSTPQLTSLPPTRSMTSIFSSPEISWQLPTLDQMFASNSFFGFPPLIPFGTEIATPKSDKNEVEKGLEGNERNVTGEDEISKNGFILSRQAGIKVRFNPPIFDNVAHFFHNIFSEEAKSLQIPPQKQCFPEGCFRLHTFQIVNFQKPETFTLKPLGPNLLLLNIANFDLNIESLLSGNIPFLLFTPMPVSGNFFVDAQELSIKALLGLQKDGKKVPSLRMVNCELIDGLINTKVTDLGLFTDSINLKYKDEILSKAKALITNTICNTIFKTIRERVNLVLSKLPQFLSVSDIMVTLFENF
uniref:Uncharacterized protein n=1 Tax=Meloidogyne incognita TaxID=6306 RepID=A0A914LFR2_MELIC